MAFLGLPTLENSVLVYDARNEWNLHVFRHWFLLRQLPILFSDDNVLAPR